MRGSWVKHIIFQQMILKLSNLLKIVCRVSGRFVSNFVKNHHEIRERLFVLLNSNKLKRELNWKPKTMPRNWD